MDNGRIWGIWFFVNHFKSRMAPTKSKLMCWLLCWTVDVCAFSNFTCLVALCATWQPYLADLAALFGWLWTFKICGTTWTNRLPILRAGVPLANTGLSCDVGRFLVGSSKSITVGPIVLLVARLWQMSPKADWQISSSGLSELELILWVVQKALDALWTCDGCRSRIVQM